MSISVFAWIQLITIPRRLHATFRITHLEIGMLLAAGLAFLLAKNAGQNQSGMTMPKT
jgi:hypothetical protein